MSKSIKVEDEVYEDLEAYRGKDETRSQAIARLVKVAQKVTEATKDLAPVLWPAHRPQRGL